MPEKYKVDEETLKLTTKCPHNFACLSDLRKFLCVAETPSGDSVYIQCDGDQESCLYCESFDDIKRMCTCPTRLELYIRYGA